MAMTPEDRERMQLLCEQIQKERDPQKFDWLVTELDQLVSTKGERLASRNEQHPS